MKNISNGFLRKWLLRLTEINKTTERNTASEMLELYSQKLLRIFLRLILHPRRSSIIRLRSFPRSDFKLSFP
ncbi:hypothetical protein L6452_43882 [Arctium lappa]|uniref:Uncharacterized protein n=1 Tax=Arctium lappa TaxID=4217 RepID=A0ACB8XEU5_ARCLA|nr:hypothetical protein L6452_43882 [Arctium lappa]